MKSLSRTSLALYVIFLSWLILFKSSISLSSDILNSQIRSLNLIPFAATAASEMIANVVVFIPLGLLLDVNFKQASFLRKLTLVSIFSLAAELIQFVLAIGVADVTDAIMNTLGGFVGLMLYGFGRKYAEGEKLDRFIFAGIASLVVLFLCLRFLVFKVRY